MTEINKVIAAMEELQAATEHFNSIKAMKMFGGVSAALEDANMATTAEAKNEAKVTMYQKFKAFLKRIVEWFKSKFAGNASKKEEAAKLKQAIDSEEAKAQKHFDDLMASLSKKMDAYEEQAGATAAAVIKDAKNSAGNLQPVPTNLDDIVIKMVQDAGIVQKRASSVLDTHRLAVFLGVTGKVDPRASIAGAEAVAAKIVPFCNELAHANETLKGQALGEKYLELGNSFKALSKEVSAFWGGSVYEPSLETVKSTPIDQVIKAIGSIDLIEGQNRRMIELGDRLQKVFSTLEDIDLGESSDELAQKIYGPGGAHETITSLVTSTSWLGYFYNCGMDVKLAYIKAFNATSVGNEDIDKITSQLVAKYNAPEQELRNAALFAVGIAHLRMMNS